MTREDELPKLTSSYRKAGGYPAQETTCLGTCCSLISNCMFATMLGIGFYMIWSMMGKPSGKDAMDFIRDFNVSDFSNVLDNIDESVWDKGFNEDPYVGDNATNVWKSATEDGLSLVLQNALDDAWQTEFEAAVEDWQESEVLDLTALVVDVDHTCTRVEGVMKVCNGNFGPTGWMGINEIELEYTGKSTVGYIVSSVAKMNEYYLNNAEYEQRQYTMCHEIGHGFGLPHTDENFYNQDQGNCLDYTNNPENNMHPGQVNMNRLQSMYGWNDDDDYIEAAGDDGNAQGDDYAAGDANAQGDDYAAGDGNAQGDDYAAGGNYGYNNGNGGGSYSSYYTAGDNAAASQQNDDNAGRRNLRPFVRRVAGRKNQPPNVRRAILTWYLPVADQRL